MNPVRNCRSTGRADGVSNGMKAIEFTKAVATGNDFVIIDRFSSGSKAGEDFSGLARELCLRRGSVGADGLLVVEASKRYDLKMRIFNPDGSEVAMCGNGSRCVALYARRTGLIKKDAIMIETGAGLIKAAVRQGDIVKVRLTDPKDIKWNFCLTIHKCPYKVSFANTGVPHVVHFVDDIENIDVRAIGESIRYHKEFSPHGTNVDFVQIVDKHTIKVRTYERGVEDETHACGTGVVASAVIAAEADKLESPITVETKGGELLRVYFDLIDGHFKNVYLEGRVKLVYKGKIIVGG